MPPPSSLAALLCLLSIHSIRMRGGGGRVHCSPGSTCQTLPTTLRTCDLGRGWGGGSCTRDGILDRWCIQCRTSTSVPILLSSTPLFTRPRVDYVAVEMHHPCRMNCACTVSYTSLALSGIPVVWRGGRRAGLCDWDGRQGRGRPYE